MKWKNNSTYRNRVWGRGFLHMSTRCVIRVKTPIRCIRYNNQVTAQWRASQYREVKHYDSTLLFTSGQRLQTATYVQKASKRRTQGMPS